MQETASSPLILIVDDEEDILALLDYNLRQAAYRTELATDGRQGVDKAVALRPDLIVLDVMMPEMDGIEACRTIRAEQTLSGVPIIMLTARSGEHDHVKGLDVGADIYLAKPVSVPVILSQIRSLLRRSREIAQHQPPADAVVRAHDLSIDREKYVVTRNRAGDVKTFRLPRKEFELLFFLAASPGRVYSREELLDRVWGTDVHVGDRTVDVHVRKIREKVGNEYIETITGVGYRFKE